MCVGVASFFSRSFSGIDWTKSCFVKLPSFTAQFALGFFRPFVFVP